MVGGTPSLACCAAPGTASAGSGAVFFPVVAVFFPAVAVFFPAVADFVGAIADGPRRGSVEKWPAAVGDPRQPALSSVNWPSGSVWWVWRTLARR
jgi:hypothetical protein